MMRGIIEKIWDTFTKDNFDDDNNNRITIDQSKKFINYFLFMLNFGSKKEEKDVMSEFAHIESNKGGLVEKKVMLEYF